MTGPALLPPALQPGDTIGVMSTSCWVDESDILKAKEFVESRGYEVFVHPQATKRLHQSAGSADDKVKAFHDLFKNTDVKAIMSARGGNRAITMLDQIDFDLVKNNPKALIGYSDLTILLNSVYARTGMVSFHGPVFRELPERKDAGQMLDILAGKVQTIDLPGAQIVRAGVAEGRLLGGNLSLFQTLLGTPYLPDMKGAILFLEDIGDHLSRYDRMLGHLRAAGILKQISGLILGQFTDIQDDEERAFGFTLEDVVREHTAGLDIPVLMNAPFGHGDDLPTFPVGCPVRLEDTHLRLLP